MAGPYAQAGRQVAAGIGSFFGDGRARQAGEMAGLQQVALQDQIAQRRADASLTAAKAQREADAAALGAPEATVRRALTTFGVPTDAATAVTEFFRTGAMPTRPAEPLAPGLQGPEAPPQPAFNIPQDVLRNIGQYFAAEQATQAGGAKSQKDYFEGLRIQPEAQLVAGIASGALAPEIGGARRAAMEGKPLVDANEYGVVNNFTGAVDATNPAAVRYAQLRAAQTGAQKANAVQSYASADKSRASAAQTRAEMAGGTGGGGGKAPAGYRWAPGGALEAIPGGPADPATKGAKQAKPPTEGQAKALMFGSRMQIADEVIGELDQQGQRTPNYLKRAAEAVPLVGAGLGMVANMTGSAGEQQVEQAQRDFINAVLRRESGAAIGQDEFTNAAQQYFPQPGDSTQVLRQKAANRRTAIAGMQAEAGEQATPDFERIVGDARQSRRGDSAPAPARAPAGGAPVRIADDAAYAALPPGTRFITPDGKTGTKR